MSNTRPVEGEPLRYWVDSSEEGLPHLVDLMEHKGNGECSCPHFRMRCLMRLRETGGGTIIYGEPNSTRCKHIHTAMLYLAETVIEQVIANKHEILP